MQLRRYVALNNDQILCNDVIYGIFIIWKGKIVKNAGNKAKTQSSFMGKLKQINAQNWIQPTLKNSSICTIYPINR